MALYEYKCNTCGKHFEYRQSMKDDALTTCPESVCEQEIKGKGDVSRLISKNIGLVFKGNGFYLTDYKHQNGSSTASNGNSPSNGNSSSNKSSKTESSASIKNGTEKSTAKLTDSA